MPNPSPAFQAAYAGTVGSIGVQLARDPIFSRRLSAAAMAFAAAVALQLTVPPEAHAQNSVKRAAMDTFAGLAGAAAGAQIGGGNGRKVAAAAGAAAGVWIAESMQGNGSPTASRSPINDSSIANFGPTGWNNNSQNMQPIRQSARQAERLQGQPVSVDRWTNTSVPGMQGAVARQVGLESGVTPLGQERTDKLRAMEAAFLHARDEYAQAIFASEQAQDDAILDPNNRGTAKAVQKAQEHVVEAQQAYGAVRTNFVAAVEHLGKRGYDVAQFSYSHRLAGSTVTADDMSRAALSKYAGYDARNQDVRAERASFDRPH